MPFPGMKAPEMQGFDRILILDWSAAGRPRRGADSIWIGGDGLPPENLPTRAAAFARIRDLTAGGRVLLGADFAFGFPSGLARAVTGEAGALRIWDHLRAHHRDDDRNASNYRDLAAAMNRAHGRALFWGDGRKTPIPDLPRLKPPPDPRIAAHRATEAATPGAARPKSVFQLAGAGAVGAQSLTGIAWLARLCDAPDVAVWPFQPADKARLVLAEVYPSMIPSDVTGHSCRDAAQVAGLSAALRHLADRGRLEDLFRPDPRIGDLADEGQILGFGHEALLRAVHAGGSYQGTR